MKKKPNRPLVLRAEVLQVLKPIDPESLGQVQGGNLRPRGAFTTQTNSPDCFFV